MRSLLLLLTALLILGVVNFNIAGKEQQLDNGRVVLLELAPVDPRSLMQGDYMALRFQIANAAFASKDLQTLDDGQLVAILDEQNVATFVRFADGAALADREVLLRYRVRNDSVKFATNAFFFEEGQGEGYTSARFGEFRVAAEGEMLLTRLRDKDLNVLGSP